jgi:hypothetical protein
MVGEFHKKSNEGWKERERSMKALFLSLTLALMATFALTSDSVALANGGKSGSGSHSSSHFGGYKNFYHNGKQFYFHHYNSSYKGWSHYCWFPKYSCYGYYCSTQSCWYCYCPQYSCYVPYSYVPTFTPQAVNLNANQNQNTNTNTNINIGGGGLPALPTGGIAIPGGGVPPAGPGGVPPMPLVK